MQIYLAVTPDEVRSASKYHRALAHVAYRIGAHSTLLRQNLLLQTHGGLLAVSDRNAPQILDPTTLCQAVLRECGRWNYQGVLLDFEEPPRRDRTTFAAKLEQALVQSRRTLYIPETYASSVPNAVMLVGTAVSGGNISDHLREISEQRKGPIALDVERLQMDFTLPARSGQGEPLSDEALQTLLKQINPAIFFSQDLCARYFTYTQNNIAHFVLFDDASTLRQKLQIGKKLGFSAAFFVWPEIKQIAQELFQ